MQNDIFEHLFDVIEERKTADPTSSYVAKLLSKGVMKMNEKVREEADEVCEAALEDDKAHLTYELCDLIFHAFVLAGSKNITLADLKEELMRREGVSGLVEKAQRGTPS